MRVIDFHDPTRHGRYATVQATRIFRACEIRPTQLGDTPSQLSFKRVFYGWVAPVGLKPSPKRPYGPGRLGSMASSHPSLILPPSHFGGPEDSHTQLCDLVARKLVVLAGTIVGGTTPFFTDLWHRMYYLGGDLLVGNSRVPLPPPWSTQTDPSCFYVDYWGEPDGTLKMVYCTTEGYVRELDTTFDAVTNGHATGGNLREMARRWEQHYRG